MANSSQYATMLMEANFDAYSPMIKNSIDRFGVAMLTAISISGLMVQIPTGMMNFFVQQ